MPHDFDIRPRVILVNRCFILNDDKKILLIRRSWQDLHRPGQWECPGGKLDEGQELSSAREREVFEETGLFIKLIHPLLYAESYIIDRGRYTGMPYVALFGIAKVTGGIFELSGEHSEGMWVSYEDALNENLVPEVKKALLVLKDYFK